MKGKRLFSLMMSGVMTASMLPAYLTQLSIPAAADDPPQEWVDDTDPTIDFDYEVNNDVHSPEDALKLLAEENSETVTVAKSDWEKNYSKYPWRHATNITIEDHDEGSLRTYLESDDPDDMYVALAESEEDTWTDMWADWEPVRITEDKVLDLNGRSLIINYNANRDNRHKDNTTFEGDWYNPATWNEYEESYDWRGRQNHENMEAHRAHLFEIDKGATLTIIDSSAWRGENEGKGTGEIRFDGYMINHISYDGHKKAWDMDEYTNRDLFYVVNGNLVIYDGHYQAGRKQTQGGMKTSFSWSDFKVAVGKAVELGVSIAEYATGVNTATAAYQDVLDEIADKNVLNGSGDSSGNGVKPKDGSGGTDETKKSTPDGKEKRNQTVGEKSAEKNSQIAGGDKKGTPEGDNQANDQETAKYDKNTKIAEAQNNIAKQATSQKGIMGMVDSAFGLFESIGGLLKSEGTERATTTIKGTCVRVESNGCFVSYGGHYEAYGSTPNVRKACVEVCVHPESSKKTWNKSKYMGGVCYIYDGLFEANSGANVFNFYRGDEQNTQKAVMYNDSRNAYGEYRLHETETNGIQVIDFENWEALAKGTETEGKPLSTANVQVRGGVFRCNYDLINMARVEDEDDASLHYRSFPGTSGSVNLGVNSFGADLIRDGRIQLVDTYGDGCLVLLDDEENGYNGLYHYRLICGDTELRTKSYLEVCPNQAQTNASFSMQLAYYLGVGKQTKEIFSDDEEGNNIRAPYRQQEKYFDFKINAENVDDEKKESAYSVKPNFHYAEADKMDVYGKEIANSEVWYYPEPRSAEGKTVTKSGYRIGDAPYANTTLHFSGSDADIKASDQWDNVKLNQANGVISSLYSGIYQLSDRDVIRDHYWEDIIDKFNVKYVARNEYEHIRTNMKYFTYKVYQVDPLTRENLPAHKNLYGVDDPLLTVRYGAAPEETALRCKLPLKEVEQRIKNIHPEWEGYRAGEMYRIVLEIEEHVGIGNNSVNDILPGDGFGQKLEPSKTTTSILFRCFHSSEQVSVEKQNLDHNFTPVQWKDYEPGTRTIMAGDYETIEVRNGKNGMTDWEADTVVFDTYYQWWECDENGNEIRMIAGTDNIYDDGLDKHQQYDEKKDYGDSHPDKADHCPSGWDFSYEENGKSFTYCNTVDPDDPDKDKLDTNGLPKRTSDGNWKWRADQIHMYTAETLVPSDIKRPDRLDENLSLKNNDVFATNHDSCYIPEELNGSYIKVKVIAVNTRWPMAYDKKQTFESHPMKVISNEGVKPTILSTFPDRGMDENENRIRYATYDKPVKFRISDRAAKNNIFRNLIEGESIHTITYKLSNGRTKEFTDLDLTNDNKSEQPRVTYPNDFYNARTILENLPAADLTVKVKVETYKDGKPFRSSDWSKEQPFVYAVEATGIKRVGDATETIYLTDNKDIRNLKQIQAFSPVPYGASRGYSFADYTNTDDKIAALDENGYITLTGKIGQTTITVKDADGKDYSKTVRVVREFDSFEISGIKPPVIGEKFITDSVQVPDGAPYHITDVTWEKGSNPRTRKAVGKDEAAAYFETYTACITVKVDDCYEPSKSDFPFSIAAEQPDGSVDVVRKTNYDANNTEMRQHYDEETNHWLPVYSFYYTYPALSDHETKEIDKIYMDFPTEVKEGENLLKWLENVRVYTNGYDKGLKIKLTPTFGPDAENIANAYGFRATSSSTEQLNYFIKGVQTGLKAEITIPDKLKESGDSFAAASDIKVYINGEEEGSIVQLSSANLWVMATDSLTITDGDFAPPKKPVYSVKDVDAVIGEPIKIEDLLVTDDPNVTIRPTGVEYDYDWEEYLKFDSEEWAFTPLETLNSSDGILLTFMIEYDEDGDGYAEYQNSSGIRIKKIYEKASDVPVPENPPVEDYGTATVIVQDPDGKELNKVDFKIRSNQDIPDPDGAFYIGFCDADGKTVSEYSFENGKTYYAKTVAADDFEIHAGVNSAYAFIRMPSGSVMNGLHISADGKHYLVGNYLRNLTPDTEYTLYYKHGANGKVYSKTFRTAKQDYGVMLGHDYVTDANLGNLEQDGWHYDPDTKTLTLKNINLNDTGADAYTVDFVGTPVPITAAVASKDALTLNLIGDNRIEYPSEGLLAYVIFAEKDLTIIGNGNLTITGGTRFFLNSHNGNICLNGTGTLTFEEGYYEYGNIAFYPENGEILYTNGTIVNQPRIATTWDGKQDQNGVLISTESVGKLNFTNKVHNIKIEAAGLDGKYETVAESDFAELIQQNYDNSYHDRYDEEKSAIRITPVHNDVNMAASPDTHESGSCEEGGTYHFSCDCGHISEETFVLPAEEHVLVKHAAVPATCEKPGTVEYWECEHCGERYADEKGTRLITVEALTVPATGHKMTHHAAVDATCTKAGSIEFWSCNTCGEFFADEKGIIPIDASAVTAAATGHAWVQHFAKPATCTKDGEIEHWVCSHCGQCSADKDGTALLKKEDITEPAFGHTWDKWTVSKMETETAEGEEIRTCSVCGETEKHIIPAKGVVTTTAKVTTTTAKATTTTAKATTTTAKATTTTAKATTTTAKATTTTAKATTTTAKATTTTAKATTTTAKATTTTAKATTTTAKATTTTAKATTTTTKVTTTTAKATTTTTKVTTTTAKATTTTAKATTTTAKATTTTAKATTTTAKATTTTAKATTTTAKATTTTTKVTTTTAKITTTTEAITTTSETTAQSTTTVITSDGSTDTTPAQTTTNAPPEPEVVTGDVDENGEVSIEDVQLALKAYTMRVSGKEMGLTDKQIKAADVNEDGELSVDDVQNILIYYVNNTVAGKSLPWEQLLGKQPQAKPRPDLPGLHEDIWIDADSYLTETEAS